MTKHQSQWIEEQQRVDQVLAEIDRRINTQTQTMNTMQRSIVDLRKQFWDDVSINTDNDTEVAETAASIQQQAEILRERERRQQLSERQITTLRRLQNSPYFARIDLQEEGDPDTDVIYLGIASLMDKDEHEFLIYDWRAPISSLFYDFSPGEVHYETPSGTISGTMKLKRQFLIRDGQIMSLFDTQTMIGDELLQEVLGQQASTNMKNIVATIQKEQNRLIRDEQSQLLIVQGAAGSGKTSAALQRVAYLLYRYRQTLQANQILLFSPNSLFNSYISTVLPELGEENMEQTTFQEWVEKQIRPSFSIEDVFALMEKQMTSPDEIRKEAVAFKSSLIFMEMMDRYVESLGSGGLIFQNLHFHDQILISKEEIQEEFYRAPSNRPLSARISGLIEWLQQECKQRIQPLKRERWVEEAIENLPESVYTQVQQRIQKQKRPATFHHDSDWEGDELANIVLRKKMKPLRRTIQQMRFIHLPAIYAQMFRTDEKTMGLWKGIDLPAHWHLIAKQTRQALRKRYLFYEDTTPFLYMQEQLLGKTTHSMIRHLFIDEAQDYSPFQLGFLQKQFPYSKMTVLGDYHQAIYPHSEQDREGFFSLTRWFSPEQVQTIRFHRTYRSTQPIVDFTKQILPDGDSIVPFERKGKKPKLTFVKNEEERDRQIVAQLQNWLSSTQYQHIAIIGKTEQDCKEIVARLEKWIPLQRISQESRSFPAGVIVIPSYLAKGIEFDAVILFDISKQVYHLESERKLFYTACTRAMHELRFYCLGEITPFVDSISDDSWQVESST